MEHTKTPWGTTGTPGEGVTGATEPPPLPPNPMPESKLWPLPFPNTDGRSVEQALANMHHGQLQAADYILRAALGLHARAAYNAELNAFYTGRKVRRPTFAESFAAQIINSNMTTEHMQSLPFDEVAPLYMPLPTP